LKLTPEQQLQAAANLRRRAELQTIPEEREKSLIAARILENLAKHKRLPS
jgi:hypothetical protein